MQSCKFYLRARCNKGSACLYSHDDSAASQQDPRRFLVCKFYQKGQCLAGDECSYFHSASDATPAKARILSLNMTLHCADSTQAPFDQEPIVRTWYGAVVQYGAGGNVTKLSMISDFSSVRLDGLLAVAATLSKLPSLLQTLGHKLLPNETVQAVKTPGTDRASVYITSDDPGFARRFCEELKKSGIRDLRAAAVPPKFPPGTITRHVDSRKVIVSWSTPSRAVSLHYKSYADAAIVGGKFNQEIYTIDGPSGIAVEAGPPTGYGSGWQILLRNAPLDITATRVRHAILSAFDEPKLVQLAKSGPSFNEEVAPAFISSLCASIGSVEYMSEPRVKGRWWRTAVHFENEPDAVDALEQLQGQPQEFLGGGKLKVQLVSTSKIKVRKAVYDAIHDQIDAALAMSRVGHKLSLKVFPDSSPESRFVNISLQGEDKAKIAALTGTIEGMLSGKVIYCGHEAFRTLAESKSAKQQLGEIQRINKVLIVIVRPKKELHYFGSPERFELVRQAVLDLGVTAARSRFVYKCTSNTEFSWVMQGGFNQISAALGEGVASFNVVSKQVVIVGTKCQYQQACTILRTQGGTTEIARAIHGPQKQEAETCSVCWTPAEDPVTLICGHTYCAECLEQLIRSAGTDAGSADLLVSCKGGEDTCKRPLSLYEMELHTSSNAFEELLGASFASYIRHRPAEYRSCPTPDCGYIYTFGGSATTSTCLNCLETTCTSCHAQHGSTTCADYKYELAGGDDAFDRYKKESGGKDCPKCSMHIEKIDGCNHMTCSGCGAHICWVCLQCFDQRADCYRHLTAAHGGYGIEIPDEDPMDFHAAEAHDLQDFGNRAIAARVNVRDRNAVAAFAREQQAQGFHLGGVVHRLFGPI